MAGYFSMAHLGRGRCSQRHKRRLTDRTCIEGAHRSDFSLQSLRIRISKTVGSVSVSLACQSESLMSQSSMQRVTTLNLTAGICAPATIYPVKHLHSRPHGRPSPQPFSQTRTLSLTV